MDRFDIYIRGFAQRDEPADAGLARVFGIDPRRARELLASLPRVVKRDVSAAEVERYRTVLAQLGAELELRRSAIRPQRVISIAGDDDEDFDLDEHGSTLNLPPPVAGAEVMLAPPSAPIPAPFALPGGPRAAVAATVSEARGSRAPRDDDTLVDRLPAGAAAGMGATGRAADTVVDARPPALQDGPPTGERTWLESRRPKAGAPASPDTTWPAGTSAPPPPPRPSAGGSAPPLRGSASVRPGSGTVSDGSAWGTLEPTAEPQVVRDPAPPRALTSAAPGPRAAALKPARAAAPGRAVPAPAPLPAPAPVFASARPPASIAVPTADAWLHAGTKADRHVVERSLPSDADELERLSLDPSAETAARRGAATVVARPDRPRVSARPANGAPAQARALASPTGPARSIGMHGQDLPDPPPAWLRWLVRAGIGASLFVIFTTLRHCRALDSDVEHALADWGERPVAAEPEAADDEAARPALGPVALKWLAHDLHQVAGADKDRARALAQRFLRAGAVEVYVGTITRLGPTQIAGELLVALPQDEARRNAVLQVHQQAMQSVFGELAPPSSAVKGDVLRVAL